MLSSTKRAYKPVTANSDKKRKKLNPLLTIV